MSVPGDDLPEDSPEELFEDAPCGYLTTRLDGTIVRVNRTLEALTGYARDELLGQRSFQDLLTVGARIYHETHYAPLLRMQGTVREIAVDLVRADGTTMPALINSVLRHDAQGAPQAIRTTVFDATDRRSYERELVRSRDREQEIARQLQRGLLGGDLPVDASLDLAIEYRPAVAGLEVGGDWYDAFWLADRQIAVVVGDVVGRGIDAATTMGQLRSGVRALAGTGLGPGALLEALDGYARRHDVGQMTTLSYVTLDLDTGALAVACAGHPPPAIAEPGQGPAFVWGGRSTPLDAALDAGLRAQAERSIAAGSTLVLFSDGLIERVDRPLQTGLDVLLTEIDRHREQPAAALAREVTSAMLAGRTTSDDVCTVALRWTPAPA
ncbi:MAG TPA: SpoIIE family protein phosphatase [Baekduia sp.]|nr:SpoIIE family protein phosphatase [Baekduia sp.]